MDVMTIRENTLGEKQDFLFSGQVPKYVIMVMVSNSAMSGEYKKNPYNFKFFNATYIDLTKDRKATPFPPFEPDFANNDYLREYMSVFQSNGLLGKNCVLPINFDEYKSGYSHLQWNLSIIESESIQILILVVISKLKSNSPPKPLRQSMLCFMEYLMEL